jgi:metal-responsive CopG/Arc/MetJ family transcriptional regulator
MTEVTISARIPRELAKELERLMREEHLEKSAALRKLLHLGLKDYRLDRALAELSKGRISLSRAAEEAGVSVWELVDEAARHRVAWVADDVIDDTHGRRRK